MAVGEAIAGGLTAVGSVLSTAIGNSANGSLNQATRRWQSEENDKGRAFAERMYNLENAYNTPSAQRARLEEAGLNPYLNTGEVGTGQANAPTQYTPASAPPAIPMQSYQDAFNNLGRFADILMKKKAVDAEVANQTADTEGRNIENASRLLSMGFSPAQVVDFMRNNKYNFDAYGTSNENRAVNALISMHQAKADLDSVQADIEQRFGYDKAQQINWNLQQQAAKTVTEMGLMNKLDKVYDSNISLNEAKIDEAIQSAYHHWSTAEYVQKLGLTEDEKREYFVACLRAQAAMDSMDFLTQHADFEEDEALRKYKGSKVAKANRVFGYGVENNMITNSIDLIGSRASKVLGTRGSVPARATLKRKSTYTENGMTPRGYKARRTVEDYEYE